MRAGQLAQDELELLDRHEPLDEVAAGAAVFHVALDVLRGRRLIWHRGVDGVLLRVDVVAVGSRALIVAAVNALVGEQHAAGLAVVRRPG